VDCDFLESPCVVNGMAAALLSQAQRDQKPALLLCSLGDVKNMEGESLCAFASLVSKLVPILPTKPVTSYVRVLQVNAPRPLSRMMYL
jgi:hypothetical protein